MSVKVTLLLLNDGTVAVDGVPEAFDWCVRHARHIGLTVDSVDWEEAAEGRGNPVGLHLSPCTGDYCQVLEPNRDGG